MKKEDLKIGTQYVYHDEDNNEVVNATVKKIEGEVIWFEDDQGVEWDEPVNDALQAIKGYSK